MKLNRWQWQAARALLLIDCAIERDGTCNDTVMLAREQLDAMLPPRGTPERAQALRLAIDPMGSGPDDPRGVDLYFDEMHERAPSAWEA